MPVVLAAAAISIPAAWSQQPIVSVRYVSSTVVILPPGAAGPNHGSQSYLGIDVRDVTEDLVSTLHLHDTHGAVIVRVDHDGPAGKAGLRERDVVLSLNGTAIEGEEPLRRMLRDMAPGRTATLVLLREGQTLTVTATMASRDDVEREAWAHHLAGPQAPAQALPGPADLALIPPDPAADPHATVPRRGNSFMGSFFSSPSYTGARLEMMGDQLAEFFGLPDHIGLLVRSVEPGSPAAQAGLRAGDVVLRANSQPVASMSDWTRLIKDAKGHPLSVNILRDHAERTLTLTPDGKRRSSLRQPAVPSAGGEYWLA